VTYHLQSKAARGRSLPPKNQDWQTFQEEESSADPRFLLALNANSKATLPRYTSSFGCCRDRFSEVVVQSHFGRWARPCWWPELWTPARRPLHPGSGQIVWSFGWTSAGSVRALWVRSQELPFESQRTVIWTSICGRMLNGRWSLPLWSAFR